MMHGGKCRGDRCYGDRRDWQALSTSAPNVDWREDVIIVAAVRDRTRHWLVIVYDPVELMMSEAVIEPMLSIDEQQWLQLVSSRDEARRFLDWEPS
jgi:hypothetical protein